MLDIRFIRENPTQVQTAADRKSIELNVEELLRIDEERRMLLQDVEKYRHERNIVSKQLSRFAQQGQTEQMIPLKEEVTVINEKIKALDLTLSDIEREYQTLMYLVPNIISPDTPIGMNDKENVVIKQVGKIPSIDFDSQDHIKLGEQHDMIDLKRGVKVAGSRHYFLKNNGAHLHRAVQQLAIDYLTDKGFTPMDVPVMTNEDMLISTGFFPVGMDQTYALEKEKKWLVGTAEVPLVGYYSNEVVDVEQPIKLAGISNCFRREAGSAGRDVHGLYRVHQFVKVEQVVICKADMELGEQLLQELTKNAENILNLLELPYRVVAVCTGDLSQKNYKQYDIETWMPSREGYGETHSSSSLLDFQARRSNIKYRDAEGNLQYCYTLNNTAIASPRILIPLIENHQRADGSIYVPKAIRPYMKGKDYLMP